MQVIFFATLVACGLLLLQQQATRRMVISLQARFIRWHRRIVRSVTSVPPIPFGSGVDYSFDFEPPRGDGVDVGVSTAVVRRGFINGYRRRARMKRRSSYATEAPKSAVTPSLDVKRPNPRINLDHQGQHPGKPASAPALDAQYNLGAGAFTFHVEIVSEKPSSEGRAFITTEQGLPCTDSDCGHFDPKAVSPNDNDDHCDAANPTKHDAQLNTPTFLTLPPHDIDATYLSRTQAPNVWPMSLLARVPLGEPHEAS